MRRIGIVNAGYGALRLLQAAQEYRLEHHRDLDVVALYSGHEAANFWVRESDDAVLVPAGPRGLEKAMATAAVDAIWSVSGPTTGLSTASHQLRAITWLGAAGEEAAALHPCRQAVPGGRQCDVQAVIDRDGSVRVVGVCEYGTLIETALVDGPTTRRLQEGARRVLDGAAGPGMCSVTFGLENEGVWSVVGVRPGLVAGHGAIEMTTGLDLVKLQLEMADGTEFREPRAEVGGHAIAVRLLAEEAGGHPLATGRIALLRFPGGPGVRVDRCVAEGDRLMREGLWTIATITAWGRHRAEAEARMRRALSETVVVIDGGVSNRGSLLTQLTRSAAPPVRRRSPAASRRVTDASVIALLAGAVAGYDADLAGDHASFFAWSRRGRPQASSEPWRRVELAGGACRYVLDVSRTGPTTYRVSTGAEHVDLDVCRVAPFESRIALEDHCYRVVSSATGSHHEIEVDGRAYHFTRDDGRLVRTPRAGVVVSVSVRPNDEIVAGDPVAVVESMKLEAVVCAGASGRVREVLAGPNVQVPAGAAIIRLEPSTAPAAIPASQLELPSPRQPRARRSLSRRREANLLTLSNLVLGFDVDPAEVLSAREDEAALSRDLGSDSATLRAEIALVRLFADLRVLFLSRHDTDAGELLVRSPQEHFFAYLRSLDPAREGLPETFVADLRRAVAHYGVHSLEPTYPLQDALFRIFQSQLRVASQVPIIMGILEGWMGSGHPTKANRRALEECLDHLEAATAHRFPVIADLAREARFHVFDGPTLARSRLAEYVAMDDRLDALAGGAPSPEREEHVAALVACPFPLAPVLLGRMAAATDADRLVALEIITRRYYRMRSLIDVTNQGRAAPMLRARYVSGEGDPVRLVASSGPWEDLHGLVAGVKEAARQAGAETVVADLYCWRRAAGGGAEDLVGHCRDSLDEAALPANLKRMTIVIGGPGGSTRMSSMHHFTFRPGEDGVAEDEFLRGLHPMMAARLRLSRLRNFHLERLPAADDVYLFRGTAWVNPDDERLFALAEVRDLSATRDEQGRIVGLPELERVLFEALAGIRSFQAHRPADRRLHWNRVILHVWPPLLLDHEDILRVARRLAPVTAGLGLERIVVRCRRPDATSGELRERVLRLMSPAATGFVLMEGDPPTEPLPPIDDYTRRVVQARRRGLTHPNELIETLSAPRAGGRTDILGGSFTEYELEGGRLAPVSRPHGQNGSGIVVGLISNRTEVYPDGMHRVALFGDPDAGPRLPVRARVPPHHRRPRSRRRPGCTGRLVRVVRRGEDRHGQRHREHGLDRRRPPADRRVHPRRRRGQRRRDGHQRRCTALLERRGDDAHAHPRHPRHDARLGHGAHGQTGP